LDTLPDARRHVVARHYPHLVERERSRPRRPRT
jgi:hypothetical protein